MRQYDTSEVKRKTIDFWANYKYPGNERDIARVYAFRELNPDTATDDQVTEAYGHSGWSPTPVCSECGRRSADTVILGDDAAAICGPCVDKAHALIHPPVVTYQTAAPDPQPTPVEPPKTLWQKLTGK